MVPPKGCTSCRAWRDDPAETMVFAECRAKRKANGGFQSCLECNARGSSKCSFVKVRRDSPEKMKAVMVSLF